MPSELQQETSRTNGAKSNGPKTKEGKARSSRNAVKHGLNSRVVVLANESQELFDQLHAAYRHEWNPQGQSEHDLVHEIAAAQWRLRRIKAMETALLDTEMFIQKPEFDQCFDNKTAPMRQADAFIMVALHNAPSVDQLNRYETRYSHIYRNSIEAQRARRAGRQRWEEHVRLEPAEAPFCACCLEALIKLQRLRSEAPEERKEIETSASTADFEPPSPENQLVIPNEPAAFWQILLRELLAVLIALRVLFTSRPVRKSKVSRELDTPLRPDSHQTAADPEIFLWKSAFATNQK